MAVLCPRRDKCEFWPDDAGHVQFVLWLKGKVDSPMTDDERTAQAEARMSDPLRNIAVGEERDAVAWRDAEIARLREFVAALFAETGWPDGGDIDGFTFQDLAVKHGILTEEQRTEPCNEGCWCDEYHGGAAGMADGVPCYRKPQWLRDAIAALAAKEGT